MLPEADLMAKRAALPWLRKRHPQWAPQELAAILGRSCSWMSTWLPLCWLLGASAQKKGTVSSDRPRRRWECMASGKAHFTWGREPVSQNTRKAPGLFCAGLATDPTG